MSEETAYEVLFKANALIKSKVNISSNEFKIFNTILYKCQKNDDSSNQMIARITLEELKKITKNRNEATPKGILETLQTFMKIPIKFETETKLVSTMLINRVEIDKYTGEFNCYLYEDLYKVLINYQEIGYSPINLKLVKQAKGYYTQRLYELFRIWSGNKKEVTYTITQLKEMLEIKSGHSYDLYTNFKNKVIISAIKEINHKLNMQVEFKENKVGRAVQSLTFSIVDNEPRKYSFRNESDGLKDKITEEDIEDEEEISSEDYVELMNLKINGNMHITFLKDFPNFKDDIHHFSFIVDKVLSSLGGKTINKRNYKYFKTSVYNYFS